MVWSLNRILGAFLVFGVLFFGGDVLAVESDLLERAFKLPWPVMSFVLGLVDGFNPCAMWSLIVLIGFLLPMENVRRRWLIGSIFIGSSAILYWGALFAYLVGFQAIATVATGGVMTWLFRIVGVVALAAGGMAIKSGFLKKDECDIRDANDRRKFHQKMIEVMERKNMWWLLIGVVGLAFSVNAIELLCSFAIPTAFTSILVSPELNMPLWKQLTAISIYDFAYILDDVVVFVIAMKTLNIKMFAGKATVISHWIGGVILLVLGGLLIFKPDLLSSLLI